MVFGLGLLEEPEVPEEVKKLARDRYDARKNKDWDKADAIRDKILEKGWIVNDIDGGWLFQMSTFEKVKDG